MESPSPETILSKLSSSQLAESLRTWYIVRENMVKAEFNFSFSSIGSCQSIWFNRNIRSKSKQFFFFIKTGWTGVLFTLVIYLIPLIQVVNSLKSLFLILILALGTGGNLIF